MDYHLENITSSFKEPVTVSEMMSQLRLAGNDEYVVILDCISTAREYAETYTGQAISPQQFRLTIDCFPDEIVIPETPLTSVDSFLYIDANGVQQTFTDYHIKRGPMRASLVPLFGEAWPATKDGFSKVVISFTAGLTSVPNSVKHAVKLIAADLFEFREDKTNEMLYTAPMTSHRLLNSIRKVGF